MTQAVAKIIRVRLGAQTAFIPEGHRHRTALQIRASRVRTAIAEGADPLLALALVVWPPEGYEEAA